MIVTLCTLFLALYWVLRRVHAPGESGVTTDPIGDSSGTHESDAGQLCVHLCSLAPNRLQNSTDLWLGRWGSLLYRKTRLNKTS